MLRTIPCGFALGALLVAAPRVALAESPGGGLTTVNPEVQKQAQEPAQEPAAPRVESAPSGSTHVFDAYRVYADSARAQRLGGAVGSLLAGGTLVGVGILTSHRWNEDFGTFMIVVGGVTVVGGVLAFVLPTEVESIASSNGVYVTSDPSPEQEAALEKEWSKLASKSKTGRQIGAGFAFVLSAAALVSGAVVLSSDGIEDDTKRWLAPVLLVSGGGMAAGGFATLMLESQAETSYAAFLATRNKVPSPKSSWTSTLRVGTSRVPGGGWVGVSANF